MTTRQPLATDPALLSPSSSSWQQEVARLNTIVKAEVGSSMHGVSVGTSSDIDEMGICIEPPEVMMAVGSSDAPVFNHWQYREQPQNVRSQAGDVEGIVYSLRKWMRMAAQGQPTQLMILFAPRDKISICTEIGQDLLDHGSAFLSKKAGSKFLGYLNAQVKRYLEGGDGHNVNRPELTEKYGFDTKAAYHALRLAAQGTELMRNEFIQLPIYGFEREYLLGVRQGEYSKDEVLKTLQHRVEDLKLWQEKSNLPDEPDYALLSRLSAHWHQRHWKAHGQDFLHLP